MCLLSLPICCMPFCLFVCFLSSTRHAARPSFIHSHVQQARSQIGSQLAVPEYCSIAIESVPVGTALGALTHLVQINLCTMFDTTALTEAVCASYTTCITLIMHVPTHDRESELPGLESTRLWNLGANGTAGTDTTTLCFHLSIIYNTVPYY